MSDPLSVLGAIIGLVVVSAELGVLAKELYESAKDAPASLALIQQEMEHLHLVFIHVQTFVQGSVKKKPNKTRLTMISLHSLMTVLSGCVLILSKLDEKLCKVACLVEADLTQKPSKRRILQFTADRIKWALWREAEVAGILQDLERHKLSLNLMLTIIQCNATSEANESLEKLHEVVEKISESTTEGTITTQLQALISRPPDASSAYYPSTHTELEDTSSLSASSLFAPGNVSSVDRAGGKTHIELESTSSTSARSPFGPGDLSSVYRGRDERHIELEDTSSTSASSLFAPGNLSSVYRARDKTHIELEDTSSTSASSLFASRNVSSVYRSRDNTDTASVRTAASSFSISSMRSVLMPSFTDELFSSRVYKRFRRRKPSTDMDSSAFSVISNESSATKGDRWSMLSDISLGDLSISEISVFELPVCLSDLYDSQPYELAMEAQSNYLPQNIQHRRKVFAWSSRGRLNNAIRTESDFVLRTLLTLGVDIEERDPMGRTPLIVAIQESNWHACTILLDRGARLDVVDSSGRTPLSHAACAHSSLDICNLLVNKGAAIDTADSTGRTPLSYAADLGRLDICNLLVDSGGVVDTVDFTGRTPLSYAADLGSFEICKLLVDSGAVVHTPDSTGRTPLSYAAAKPLGLCVCKLLVEKGAAVDIADSTGKTPLLYAASEYSSIDIFKLLVDKGAAVDTTDSAGRTPMSYAAHWRRVDICKLLVDKGAMVDAPDCTVRTPLSYAASKPLSLDICKFLVENGAAVDIADSSGRTPLSYAASIHSNLDVCKLLVEKGAAVNTADSSGRTAMSYAFSQPNLIEVYNFLVAYGGRPLI